MYSIYVIFKTASGKREEFVEKIKQAGIVSKIRQEAGCIMYDYFFAEKNRDEILLIEKWESKEHQETHIRQPHMNDLHEIEKDYIESVQFGEFELNQNI